MKYRNLGRRGPRVSVIGLGFWQAGGKSWKLENKSIIQEVVLQAISHGINFFDTAEIYGWGESEKILGDVIKSIGIGEEVFVASKLGGFRVSEYLMTKGINGINRRLGKTVDLIQLHWPPPITVPLCHIIRSLESLVKKGLANYYGLSNFNAALLEKTLECSKVIEPISNQVQYSLAYRTPEHNLKQLMEKNGIALIAWSPLAKGSLAGGKGKDLAQKRDPVYKTAIMDAQLQKTLEIIAEKKGVSKAVIALSWLIYKNAIPIPGTRKPYRVKEIALSSDINLSEDELKELDNSSEKYLRKWGMKYKALWYMRYIPCLFQYLSIRVLGGI